MKQGKISVFPKRKFRHNSNSRLGKGKLLGTVKYKQAYSGDNSVARMGTGTMCTAFYGTLCAFRLQICSHYNMLVYIFLSVHPHPQGLGS